MTLPQIRDAYKKRAERLQNRPARRQKASVQQIDRYYLAANHIQTLIDQGPLPTGQVWNLGGRELPTTTWGAKVQHPKSEG